MHTIRRYTHILRRLWRRTHGQSLVYVALFMSGFIMMLALVLDGANIFMQHRMNQNAVDAGARAATRALALGNNDATVWGCVRAFTIGGFNCLEAGTVTGNGSSTITADYVDRFNNIIWPVNTGAIPVNARGVRVVSSRQFSGLFVGIFNVNLPGAIGMSVLTAETDVWSYPAQAQTTFASSARATYQMGTLMSITNAKLYPIVVKWNPTWQFDQLVDIFDTGNNSNGSFGWFSFNGNGSTSTLRSWIANGFTISASNPVRVCTGSGTGCSNKATLEWPTWMQTNTGVSAAALQDVGDHIGERWVLPVYDTSSGTGSNKHYRIIGLAEFQIHSVQATGNPKKVRGYFRRQVMIGKVDMTQDCLEGVNNGYGMCVVGLIE